MPAPAVIPAPQAYTNVAVVKTFVVRVSVFRRLTGLGQPPSLKGNFRGLGGPDVAFVCAGRSHSLGEACRFAFSFSSEGGTRFHGLRGGIRLTTVNKSACSKQANEACFGKPLYA